jgi:signal transduction histidine kinase
MPGDPTSLADSFRSWRNNFWTRLILTSGPAHRRRLALAALVGVLVIGILDYLTGFELTMQVFYILPITLAVAAFDWPFGIVLAVASVIAGIISDIASGAKYESSLVPTWNGLISLGVYLMVVWLESSLLSLQREMNERVRQRTTDLTAEMAERERLEREVLDISERERRVIGHELHDGLSQHLTGTSLVAQALHRRLAARQAEETADMAQVITLVDEGIEQTRMLAKGLLLAEVDREGLEPALREFAAEIRRTSRVDLALRCEGPLVLPEDGTATQLFRITQEAVRNALRHGQARHVDVAVVQEHGALDLTIRDDGTGLPPSADRRPGLGLRIMAHRAAIIGAKFAVAPAPEGGTLVTCHLAELSRSP